MQPLTIAIVVVIIFLIAAAVILACLRAQTALENYDQRPPIDLSGQGRARAAGPRPKASPPPPPKKHCSCCMCRIASPQRPGQSRRVDVMA